MVAYTGIETISNMAEEARDAQRTIPRGTGLTVIAVVGLYALLPAIALSAMPVFQEGGEFTTELATRYADDPVLGIVENIGLAAGLTDVLRVYVGILAAVILLIATNAALIGLSRLTFSMGQHRQLPAFLRRVHPRFKTPYTAIVVFSGVAALVMAPGETKFLGAIYAFGATLSFTVAHVSVVRLRKVYPLSERRESAGVNRVWRPLGNVRIRGVDVPPTAILGGLGTATAFVVAMALEPVILVTGGGWMLAGLALYYLYRRHQGLPLRETVKVEALEPLGVEEVEYKSVLIAFADEPFSEETVATAAALAAKRRRAIHVLSLLEVPTHLPLDAPLKEKESEAQSRVERAKLIAGMRVTGQVRRIRPGQAGTEIIRRAKEIDAAAIVMQLGYRNGTPMYGKTLQSVLATRPCRVIVAACPEEARERPEAVPA
jgi:basic amino acid/polyamine antiporter, APA family